MKKRGSKFVFNLSKVAMKEDLFLEKLHVEERIYKKRTSHTEMLWEISENSQEISYYKAFFFRKIGKYMRNLIRNVS